MYLWHDPRVVKSGGQKLGQCGRGLINAELKWVAKTLSRLIILFVFLNIVPKIYKIFKKYIVYLAQVEFGCTIF